MRRRPEYCRGARTLALSLSLLGAGTCLWAQAGENAAAGWNFSGQSMEIYNNNVQDSLTQPQADTSTLAQFSLLRYWAEPTWSLSLSYSPSADAYVHERSLDYIAENFAENLSLALSPHANASWVTTAFSLPESSATMGMGAGASLTSVATPSQFVATGEDITGINSTLSLSYQYDQRSSIVAMFTASGDSFSADTALLDGGPAPPNSTQVSIGGSLTWSHALRPGQSFSLVGTNDEMWYRPADQRLTYSSLQAQLTQALGKYLSLTLGGGPSSTVYANNEGNSEVHQPAATSYAASTSLTYMVAGAQYGISWQHMDMLGLGPGTITTDLIGVRYSYNWTRDWSLSLNAGWSANGQAADSDSAVQHGMFLTFRVQYQIAPGWSVTANHMFNALNEPLTPQVMGTVRASQFSLGVSYTSGRQ